MADLSIKTFYYKAGNLQLFFSTNDCTITLAYLHAYSQKGLLVEANDYGVQLLTLGLLFEKKKTEKKRTLKQVKGL